MLIYESPEWEICFATEESFVRKTTVCCSLFKHAIGVVNERSVGFISCVSCDLYGCRCTLVTKYVLLWRKKNYSWNCRKTHSCLRLHFHLQQQYSRWNEQSDDAQTLQYLWAISSHFLKIPSPTTGGMIETFMIGAYFPTEQSPSSQNEA